VAQYLMAQKPDLDLRGIDLAPRMVEVARKAAPCAKFAVHDCRKVIELKTTFDAIMCAFGLPYLSRDEAIGFIGACFDLLNPSGVLCLSTILGKSEDSGFERCGTGEELFITYYGEEEILHLLTVCGFTILKQCQVPSPSGAAKKTTDLFVIARKR
jgi:2-polyprenyl-3-methyl-5-hydroxy-6-metoxy-1,4-benzoquinol methylase